MYCILISDDFFDMYALTGSVPSKCPGLNHMQVQDILLCTSTSSSGTPVPDAFMYQCEGASQASPFWPHMFTLATASRHCLLSEANHPCTSNKVSHNMYTAAMSFRGRIAVQTTCISQEVLAQGGKDALKLLGTRTHRFDEPSKLTLNHQLSQSFPKTWRRRVPRGVTDLASSTIDWGASSACSDYTNYLELLSRSGSPVLCVIQFTPDSLVSVHPVGYCSL
ncbi:uncharacterized protein B0T23DRAFT_422966 [Neurospora hispaniola]|uniref:Uncharacterized protein n=1 Tax=Neurospora hispaniola TaxID=588809 RepID=A0AAJ0I0L1_9PEZI|nr:hypothetical protein B0T23DRAFT_422966 [Neurospora hispaniola]